jgi:hypothetical protein
MGRHGRRPRRRAACTPGYGGDRTRSGAHCSLLLRMRGVRRGRPHGAPTCVRWAAAAQNFETEHRPPGNRHLSTGRVALRRVQSRRIACPRPASGAPPTHQQPVAMLRFDVTWWLHKRPRHQRNDRDDEEDAEHPESRRLQIPRFAVREHVSAMGAAHLRGHVPHSRRLNGQRYGRFGPTVSQRKRGSTLWTSLFGHRRLRLVAADGAANCLPAPSPNGWNPGRTGRATARPCPTDVPRRAEVEMRR